MSTPTCGHPLASGKGACKHKVTAGQACAAGHPAKATASTPMTTGTSTASSDPFAGQTAPPAHGIPDRVAEHIRVTKPKITYSDDWFTACGKCDGTGSYKKPGYGTPDCFACSGSGRNYTPAGKKAAKAAREAALATAHDDFLNELAADPELRDAVIRVVDASVEASAGEEVAGGPLAPELAHQYGRGTFPHPAHDIVWKAMTTGRAPSPKAADFLKSLMVQHDEKLAKAADAKPAPKGVVTETFTVLKSEYRANNYGYGGSQHKLLLEHQDGYRVWATCPAALSRTLYDPEDLRGATVRFQVDLNPKDDDPLFAVGKRPKVVEVGDGYDDVPPSVAHAARKADASPETAKQVLDTLETELDWKSPADRNRIASLILTGDTDRAAKMMPPDKAALLFGVPVSA